MPDAGYPSRSSWLWIFFRRVEKDFLDILGVSSMLMNVKSIGFQCMLRLLTQMTLPPGFTQLMGCMSILGQVARILACAWTMAACRQMAHWRVGLSAVETVG